MVLFPKGVDYDTSRIISEIEQYAVMPKMQYYNDVTGLSSNPLKNGNAKINKRYKDEKRPSKVEVMEPNEEMIKLEKNRT